MSDLIVIGGGVVGLSVAWEAARRGWKTTLLERDQIGRGASWAGAGILPPGPGQGADHPLDALARRARELHAQWAVELRERTGIDNGFRPCGGLYLTDTPGEAAALGAAAITWEEEGWRFERWSAAEVMQHYPSLRGVKGCEGLRGAIWFPDEAQLRNPHHLRALEMACRDAGAQLVEQAEVQGLEARVAGGWGVRTSAGEFAAARVCLCGGAWSRLIGAQLGLPLEIVPIRGQMLLYRFESRPFSCVLNVGPRYLVPRDDGHVLVGATEEEAGFEIATTHDGLMGLKAFAERWLPGAVGVEPVASWAGLRPGSVDGFPYIGSVAAHPGLFVASGHFRAGLSLSPATAELVVDLMEEREPRMDPLPFRPERGLHRRERADGMKLGGVIGPR